MFAPERMASCAPRVKPWLRATPVEWNTPARRPAPPTPQATPSASNRPRPARNGKPKLPTGCPSHHAATVVVTSTARKTPQFIAAVQAACPCSSPRADSQFAGLKARGNSNSTPTMNSNAFHFAANPPVTGRGPGRCPGAAGSWLGVSIMPLTDVLSPTAPSGVWITHCRSAASRGGDHAKESNPSAARRLQRLLGRTAPTMERLGDRDRVLRRDPKERQRRPVWNAASLLPIAQRRHIDTDHEREFALRGAQLLSNRLDVGRLERGHPGRAQGAPTNTTGLSNAGDQLLKRIGFHLNSSRMSAARTRAWLGVRSPCSFLA